MSAELTAIGCSNLNKVECKYPSDFCLIRPWLRSNLNKVECKWFSTILNAN